jgi:ABC-type sugar transport system substrate-binding protein
MGKLRWGALFGVLAASSVLAACGSSSSSSTSGGTGTSGAENKGVAEAKQLVAQALKEPTWQGPTDKVNTAKAKGKTVYFINLTEQIPALHEWSVVMGQQLQQAGVKVQKCDGKGAPNTITACLQKSLAAKPDVIVALALDTKLIANVIKQADAQGIKFITAQTGTPEQPTTPPGRHAEVTFDYPGVGKMLGDWFVADSECKKGAPKIVTTTSSREPSEAEVNGMTQEIERLCPGMNVDAPENVLIPDWPTKLPTVTKSILLQNPNLQYLLPLYDGMTIYMVPSAQGIHRSQPLKMASFNATPVVMQNELAKESPLAADVGGPNQWFGVAMADQALRAAAGDPPVADEKVPLRLFTRDNINTIDVKKDEKTWYGTVDPICEYHKLWGLPCS